ncbi:hypothetical protein F8388_019232 [Cannabis sativa]|uniref:Ribosomal protein L23 n=1 Tax=Cannabis sativa TaxID=3483 RepID=A0A7J6F5X1_CANSA|nr:hypothetical protein F8388_019232 [Cannabis sativa]
MKASIVNVNVDLLRPVDEKLLHSFRNWLVRTIRNKYTRDVFTRNVRTLNMQGKKKFKGKSLVAKPNYKKVYVTLKNPSSIFPALYNTFNSVEDDAKE